MNRLALGLAICGFTLLTSAAFSEDSTTELPPAPPHWDANTWDQEGARNFWKKRSPKTASPEKRGALPQPAAPAKKSESPRPSPCLLDRQTEK